MVLYFDPLSQGIIGEFGKHAKGVMLWCELVFDIIYRKRKGKGLPFTHPQVAVAVDLTVLILFNPHQIHIEYVLGVIMHIV